MRGRGCKEISTIPQVSLQSPLQLKISFQPPSRLSQSVSQSVSQSHEKQYKPTWLVKTRRNQHQQASRLIIVRPGHLVLQHICRRTPLQVRGDPARRLLPSRRHATARGGGGGGALGRTRRRRDPPGGAGARRDARRPPPLRLEQRLPPRRECKKGVARHVKWVRSIYTCDELSATKWLTRPKLQPKR